MGAFEGADCFDGRWYTVQAAATTTTTTTNMIYFEALVGFLRHISQ
jgi:hypothetical protein